MYERGPDEPSGSAPLLVSLAMVVIVTVTVMVLGRDAVDGEPTGLATTVSETTSPVPVPLAPVEDPTPLDASPATPVPSAGTAAGPAPVARVAPPVLRVLPGQGAAGLPLRVELDASRSIGRGLSYHWDLDGDDVPDDATWVRPAITFASAGRVPITLVVTDAAGRRDRATVVVRPGQDRSTSPCRPTLRECRTAQR